MSEGTQGVIIFAALVAVTSVVAHWRSGAIIKVSLATGLIVAVAFLLMDSIHRGYIDKFAPIAFAVTLAVAIGGSFVIGVLFAIVRRRQTR